jgi:hypothetical protein
MATGCFRSKTRLTQKEMIASQLSELEQKPAHRGTSGFDMYNLRLTLHMRSKEWLEEIYGPPCLVQRHPDRNRNKRISISWKLGIT